MCSFFHILKNAQGSPASFIQSLPGKAVGFLEFLPIKTFIIPGFQKQTVVVLRKMHKDIFNLLQTFGKPFSVLPDFKINILKSVLQLDNDIRQVAALTATDFNLIVAHAFQPCAKFNSSLADKAQHADAFLLIGYDLPEILKPSLNRRQLPIFFWHVWPPLR